MSLSERFAERRQRWLEDLRTTLCDVQLEGGTLAGVAHAALGPQVYEFAAEHNLPVRVQFLAPERRYLLAARAFVLAAPRPDAETVNEALYGEALALYDRRESYCRVATERDGYLGWLPLSALGHQRPEPSHRLVVLRAHLYAAPRVSSPRRAELAFGTELQVRGEEEGWCEVQLGKQRGYLRSRQLWPLERPLPEAEGKALCSFARRFLETPYVWGGVTAWGLDCSGLVQTAFSAFGRQLPRDSDMQAALGRAVDLDEVAPGDLLFFPGHVALSLGGERFIHANAHHMRVSIDHFGSSYGQGLRAKLTGVRRLELSASKAPGGGA